MPPHPVVTQMLLTPPALVALTTSANTPHLNTKQHTPASLIAPPGIMLHRNSSRTSPCANNNKPCAAERQANTSQQEALRLSSAYLAVLLAASVGKRLVPLVSPLLARAARQQALSPLVCPFDAGITPSIIILAPTFVPHVRACIRQQQRAPCLSTQQPAMYNASP
jgi:hypothetical protein